jgi:hypothetical protein
MYLNTQVSVKENENKLEYAKGQSSCVVRKKYSERNKKP